MKNIFESWTEIKNFAGMFAITFLIWLCISFGEWKIHTYMLVLNLFIYVGISGILSWIFAIRRYNWFWNDFEQFFVFVFFFAPNIAQRTKVIFPCFESINNSVFRVFGIFGILECYGLASIVVIIRMVYGVWYQYQESGTCSIWRSFLFVVKSITGLGIR